MNILHFPEITNNILFVYQFTLHNDIFVEFHPFFCLVKDIKTKQVLLRDEHKDALYLLHHHKKFFTFFGAKSSHITWHNHMGHPHFKTLQNVINKYRLLVTHKLSHYLCDACCLSKSHKLSFKISLHKSSKPLDLMHSDI